MRRFHTVGAWVLIPLLGGCCATRHGDHYTPPQTPANPPPNRHLIFSPDTEETFVYRDDYSPWPAAVESYQPLEIIDYREIISDRQDHWSARNDQHYRRFDSVRIGRQVR